MPMDGLTIGAVVYELNTLLSNARVDKINQPESDEIHIFCRNNGKNRKLLLCSNACFARLNITDASKPNPAVPGNFCMLLRKHLTGARISGVTQVGNERIVKITFECLNDFNEHVKKLLVLEIMGKHSNIIFIDENDRIYDSIRRVNSLMSRVRLVQPGLAYIYPPSQDKTDPFLARELPLPPLTARNLSEKYIGISMQAAQEIEYRANKSSTAFGDYIDIYRRHDFSPVLLLDDNGEPVDFYAVEQQRFLPEFQKKYSMVSEAIDKYFVLKDKVQRIKEHTHDLRTKLCNLLEKSQKKNAQQHEKLLECADMEKYRIWGELITANIYLIKKGAVSVTVQNYYDDMNAIEIPLDNTISPSANAQKYFKHYNKLKTASKLLAGQMDETEKEIDFFTIQLENLDNCENEDDIAEIRQELINLGYLKQQKVKQKTVESKPMHFVSSSGIDIYVGKNNTQNDRLTLRFAASDDLWLHTKDVHGSHVIVKSNSPDEKTVEEAAQLAAYYSKARNSAAVPVDATKRRFVKKPSGALPGKVIYSNQATYYITPDEKLVRLLKRDM